VIPYFIGKIKNFFVDNLWNFKFPVENTETQDLNNIVKYY